MRGELLSRDIQEKNVQALLSPSAFKKENELLSFTSIGIFLSFYLISMRGHSWMEEWSEW